MIDPGQSTWAANSKCPPNQRAPAGTRRYNLIWHDTIRWRALFIQAITAHPLDLRPSSLRRSAEVTDRRTDHDSQSASMIYLPAKACGVRYASVSRSIIRANQGARVQNLRVKGAEAKNVKTRLS